MNREQVFHRADPEQYDLPQSGSTLATMWSNGEYTLTISISNTLGNKSNTKLSCNVSNWGKFAVWVAKPRTDQLESLDLHTEGARCAPQSRSSSSKISSPAGCYNNVYVIRKRYFFFITLSVKRDSWIGRFHLVEGSLFHVRCREG